MCVDLRPVAIAVRSAKLRAHIARAFACLSRISPRAQRMIADVLISESLKKRWPSVDKKALPIAQDLAEKL